MTTIEGLHNEGGTATACCQTRFRHRDAIALPALSPLNGMIIPRAVRRYPVLVVALLKILSRGNQLRSAVRPGI
jgi:hypothetical protein